MKSLHFSVPLTLQLADTGSQDFLWRKVCPRDLPKNHGSNGWRPGWCGSYNGRCNHRWRWINTRWAIAQISGKVAEHGLIPFLSIMAYISISLGLINLFPIPLLDGGHLFFYLIEFLRGKPLSENVQIYFYKFGMAVLFTLMFFATFNDLKSLGLF